MKLIITEEQYNELMESLSDEGELYPIDFNEVIGDSLEDKLKKVMTRYNKVKRNHYGIKLFGSVNFSHVYCEELYSFCESLVEVNGDFKMFNRKGFKFPILTMVSGILDLEMTKIKALPKLKYVGGSLDLYNSKIESLPNLERVEGRLDLSDTLIEFLPELRYVEGALNLKNTRIKTLPLLYFVGGYLRLTNTPLSQKIIDEYSEEERIEFMKKIDVRGTNIIL